MKKITYYLSMLSCLLITHSVVAQADLKVEVQEQSNWCWAANAKCIFNYYNIKQDAEQCDIVNWSFKRSNCCQNKSRCNQMNEMDPIYKICSDFGGLRAEYYDGPLSKETLYEAHEEQRPYIIGCMWSGGNGGHVVVGCAFQNNKVTVMDPWRNNGIYTFKYTGNASMSLNGQSGRWREGVEILEPFLSVDEMFKSEVNIYPTIVNTRLYIESDNAKNITVYNALGKVIASRKLIRKSSSIDMSNMPSGIYFVRLSDNTSREASFKVIKQ